jgi:hypothetical protein
MWRLRVVFVIALALARGRATDDLWPATPAHASRLALGASPPCPFAEPLAGVDLANAAVHALTLRGRLEEARTCNALLLDGARGGAAMPSDAREAVRGNQGALNQALAPWRAGVARLYHNINGSSDEWPPHSDTPLARPRKARGPWKIADAAIQVTDAMLTEAECAAIIDLFEASELFQGNVVSNGQVIVRKEHKFVMEYDVSGGGEGPNATAWAAVDRLMVDVTTAALNEYEMVNPVLRGMRNPLPDEGFRMKRYRAGTGEHHAYHADSGQEATSRPFRIIAVLIYLNSVDAGGETAFLNQGVAVPPKCGRVLMFPAAFPYVHAGRRVREGVKYVVAGMLNI